LKAQCTPGKERRIRRWEHEAGIEAMQERLDRKPDAMRIRRATVEHAFGTLKAWMGATHFKTRTLPGEGPDRDEPARAGLQSEADDRDHGRRIADPGDAGLIRRHAEAPSAHQTSSAIPADRR
jgi:hypothetical protein